MKRAKASPDPIDVHVGRRVRERRTTLGVSQESLGELLGVTFQQIQKYERGANRIGSGRLMQIARALDVPPAFFFEGAPEDAAAVVPMSGLAEADTAFDRTGAPAGDSLPDSRETAELARAYGRIGDAAVRRRLLELARALGGVRWREGIVPPRSA
jgi:transcriptional regulator with XRE-family HTH domain